MNPGKRAQRRSPTVPGSDQSEADVLAARDEAWRRRPVTREVYRRYFDEIGRRLAPGRSNVELGGGSGLSREFLSGVWVSDLVPTRFVDFVADANALPLATGGIDNLVTVDLVHHLPRPARLFGEAIRVLRSGGRMILVEPYLSPASRLIFRLGHPEPFDTKVDPLAEDDAPLFTETGAFASNQAIPTLLFGRDRVRFQRRFPALHLRERRLMSVFVYPLSGGFSGPCLLPRFALPPAWGVEAALRPLGRLLALRMLVVLERD